METGINWLEKTFGQRPRVGWQIDPFGHSALSPYIYSELGFDAIVLDWAGTTMELEFARSYSRDFFWKGMDYDEGILAHLLV